MRGGQLLVTRPAGCETMKAASEGLARPEHSAQRSRCFLKADDEYSQGARVVRNAIATFVFKRATKQARETDNFLK